MSAATARRAAAMPPRPINQGKQGPSKIYPPRQSECITLTMFAGPDEVSSQFSQEPEYRYRWQEGTMYASQELMEAIEALELHAGERVQIARDGADWICERIDGAPSQNPATGAAAPRARSTAMNGAGQTGIAIEAARVEEAGRRAIDIWAGLVEYARAKGLQLAPNAGDIRATANTIAIGEREQKGAR